MKPKPEERQASLSLTFSSNQKLYSFKTYCALGTPLSGWVKAAKKAPVLLDSTTATKLS